jgi:hypothetical protein
VKGAREHQTLRDGVRLQERPREGQELADDDPRPLEERELFFSERLWVDRRIEGSPFGGEGAPDRGAEPGAQLIEQPARRGRRRLAVFEAREQIGGAVPGPRDEPPLDLELRTAR